MALKCALLSTDAVAVKVLRQTLSTLKFDVELLADNNTAFTSLAQTPYDAVVLDMDGNEEVRPILQKLRTEELNRNSIAIALCKGHDGCTAGLQSGANFALDKPLRADTVNRTLKVAQALMLKNVS
jgi:DNA-binding response OmpR family regulator